MKSTDKYICTFKYYRILLKVCTKSLISYNFYDKCLDAVLGESYICIHYINSYNLQPDQFFYSFIKSLNDICIIFKIKHLERHNCVKDSSKTTCK